MKARNLSLAIMLLSLAAWVSAQYPRILWVSDGWQEPTPRDAGFVNLLIEQGYTVDRMQTPRTMNTAQRDLANTYDLVIVSRWAVSGEYNNTGERELWNSITTPLINMNAYICRSSHWRWIEGTNIFDTTAALRVVAPQDPIFGGVILDVNDQAAIISQGSVSVITVNSPGNGTLLGHRAVTTDPSVWIVRWETGQEFYSGSGQFAGGPRLYFPGGEAGGSGDGVYNFTTAGRTIFLNAVYELSGATFNRPPMVNAGGERIVHINDDIQPGASVYEPDGDEVTAQWTVLSGTGDVTFSDNTVIDPFISFDTKGTYVLRLQIDDGQLTADDTLTVYVRDPADDRLLSHWTFEGLPDPNILVDVAGGFNGVFYHSIPGTEPNAITGHMSPTAVDFGGQQYWEVPGTTGNVDPNYTSTQTGLTVAVWAKIEESPDVGAPMLVGYDLAGWRFQVNTGRWNLVQTGIAGAPQREVSSLRGAFRPEWQHVVGVFDGVNSQFRIYIDGLLDNTLNLPSGYRVGTGTMPLQIGNRADADRPWPGMVDDIRVYNYPLTDAEIAVLADEGDKAPYITAGESRTIIYTGEPIQMTGVRLIDDGIPAPLALEWSVVTVPSAGIDPEDVIFADPTAEDTLVTFPTIAGGYRLRLSGYDGAMQVEDEVVITLVIPTCEDVIAAGLGMPGDLSGPDGVPDCVIDLYDLVVLATDWLNCNDPQDVNCEWPF